MNRQPTMVLAGALIALSGCGAGGTEAASERAASSSPSASASATVASPPSSPSTPTPSSTAPLRKTRTVYWQNLKPGMCLMIPEEESAYDVKVTDCRAEHHAEVMLRTDLPGEGSWPGDDVVDAAAAAVCEKTLQKYIGLPFDSSRLEIDFFTTEKAGWVDGDRRLICLVYDPDAETTAVALKGSKQ